MKASAPEGIEPTLEPMEDRARAHRRRLLLLALIPVAAIAAAAASLRLLDSRPGAGVVLLVGCALWIATFASDVGEDTPRRDRTRSSGLGFGRNR